MRRSFATSLISLGKNRAFSLTEVVVVIAIVLVIAAILGSVLLGARARSQSVTCLSVEKQLSSAMMLYAADHDEAYAMSSHMTEGYWVRQLLPYAVNRELHCPSFTKVYREGPFSDYAKLIGYALNGCLKGTQPALPSNTILLTEVADIVEVRPSGESAEMSVVTISRPDDIEYGEDILSGEGVRYAGGPFGSQRHQGGSNLTMADGHTSWKRPTEIAYIYPYNPCSLVATKPWKNAGSLVNPRSHVGFPASNWQLNSHGERFTLMIPLNINI